MAYINKQWKRFLAVTCTHAKHIDPTAWQAVLTFKERFKPNLTLHLGDAIDMTGLMAHGQGSGSKGDDLSPDIDTGLMHLRELKPQIFLLGNHEDRAYKLAMSKNEATAYGANKACEHIEKTCQKIRCQMIPYTGIEQIKDIADIGFTHGTIYNEMAARDMAVKYCNGSRRKIIFGHTHKVAVASAPTKHGGTGYNIGTLTAKSSLEYAKNRPSTFAWTQAFCWGYYNEELKQSSVHITQRNHDEVWHLPL